MLWRIYHFSVHMLTDSTQVGGTSKAKDIPTNYGMTRHSQVSLPVNLLCSDEFRGESSSSDHLSPSSPTAKMVSPSSDSRGLTGGAVGAGFGGIGDASLAALPFGTGVRSPGIRPSSSSSSESAIDLISKPSSSCASCAIVSANYEWIRENIPHHSWQSGDCSLLAAIDSTRMQYQTSRPDSASHRGRTILSANVQAQSSLRSFQRRQSC